MIKPGGRTIVDKMSARRDHLNTLKSRSNREHLENKKKSDYQCQAKLKVEIINKGWCFDNYRFQISLNFHIVTIFWREKIKQQLGTRITSYYCEQEGKKKEENCLPEYRWQQGCTEEHRGREEWRHFLRALRQFENP